MVAPSPLQALDRQLDIPVLAPQSYVPQARYDIASADGEDGLPWDGLPDDAPPARVFERGGASWYGCLLYTSSIATTLIRCSRGEFSPNAVASFKPVWSSP